jgi:threonine synthase
LDAEYDLAALRGAWAPAQLNQHTSGIARWRELLPLAPEEPLVSMGEGDTPLIPAPAEALGCGNIRLLLKLETCNPNGSFKDRAIAVAVSKARASGASTVVISSTGNAGTSLAAYSAHVGLPCVVLFPATTPSARVAQIAAFGAQLIRVEGDISAPFRLAKEAAKTFGWANMATTYLSPYPTEGDKTIGFEIAMALDWEAPDWILVPVGDGPLLYACYKAFVELKSLGLGALVPKFAAVQAAGCAPIYRAWQAGVEQVTAWDTPQTVAGGIADPLKGYPQDGTFTLRAVRESGGIVLAVTDEEILAARDDLMRRAGVLAEPTGAVPLAGLRHMLADGQLADGQTVVLLITGRLVRESRLSEADLPAIPADSDALERVVGPI